MSKLLILFTILASIFGTQAFAADAPAGQSVLKLSAIAEENPVREARKELAKVEKEIAGIDKDLQVSRAEAISLRGAPAFSRTVKEQAEARAIVLEMQKSQLTAKKSELEAQLTSSAN